MEKAMPKWLSAVLGTLERVCIGISQLTLFTMMLAISVDALGRYLFGRPLQGGYEITSLYFMVILTFLGMPAIHGVGGHIRIDALMHLLNWVPLRIHERASALLAAAAFGFMAWHTGLEGVEKILVRETAMGAIQMPLYLSYVWVPIGCALLALRLAVEVGYPPDRALEAQA
jgi:TRAP-type C4-dicarboxylate transport system permease small subunit